MNIPRDLEELLASVKDIKVDDIDESIGKNVWTKRFSDYLSKRDLEDDLQCLRFLLKMQLLLTLDRKIDKDKSGGGKTVTQWQKERAVIFRKILVAHFNDDEDILPMANGDLQEALCQWTRDPGNPVTESDLANLRKALTDSSILSDGLEPRYMVFVRHYLDNQSKLACLLSIL